MLTGWITKYHRARPGAEVLMENINDFLVDYAAQKERVIMLIFNYMHTFYLICNASTFFSNFTKIDILLDIYVLKLPFCTSLYFLFLTELNVCNVQEKKEREEEAAEGGWTVVTHIKGRKKTTEAESGTTVGSVAPAAVMDKLSKKKDKPVGLNLYRFQKREAQRNGMLITFYMYAFSYRLLKERVKWVKTCWVTFCLKTSSFLLILIWINCL